MENKVVENHTFFAELTTEEQQFLLAQGTEITVKKGDSLYLEGDLPNHIYLLKSGLVRLSKTTIDGRVLFFQMKNENDLIGELSLFNNLKITFNADVIKDSVLIRFDRHIIEELCKTNGSFALAFIRWFSDHNNTILAQFRDLIFCGKKEALSSILIRLIHSYGVETNNGIRINKKITNQELANYIGATRESIHRILKSLTKDEIISINTKYITVHNLAYLKQELRCDHCPFEGCTL